MSKLSDVELSQRGEAKTLNKVNETAYIPPHADAEDTTARQRFVIFKLVRKRRRVRVDGICDAVFNPKTKKRERIWLLNGADSIWQSELLDLLKDKDYVSRNRRSLLFEDGICLIKTEDERAVEFARACGHNIGTKNRSSSGKYDFYEYDAAREQAERLKKQMTRIDMVVKAKEMPVEKMKKLSSFLGISQFDDLGQPKGDDGIRAELMIRADNDPITFSKYIDSAEVEVSYMVKRAIIDTKIDLHGQSGNAIWSGGKGFICKIPAGRKAHEYLTELAMTNSDEGRNFKQQLETIVT